MKLRPIVASILGLIFISAPYLPSQVITGGGGGGGGAVSSVTGGPGFNVAPTTGNVQILNDGTLVTTTGANGNSTVSCSTTVTFTNIANGKTAIVPVDTGCRWTQWQLRSDQNISATIDVQRAVGAAWTGTGTGTSMVNLGRKPVIAGATRVAPTTIGIGGGAGTDTGWTSVTTATDDTLEFVLSGVTVGSATQLVLVLGGTR